MIQVELRQGRWCAKGRSGMWVDEQAMRNALETLRSRPGPRSLEIELTRRHYIESLTEIERARHAFVS